MYLVCKRKTLNHNAKQGHTTSVCPKCNHYLFIPEKLMLVWYKFDALVICEVCAGQKAGVLLKEKLILTRSKVK